MTPIIEARGCHGAFNLSFKLNFTSPSTAGSDGGSSLLDRCLSYVELAFLRLENAVGAKNGIAPLGSDGQIDVSFLAHAAEVALTPSTLHVTGTAAANTAVTVTLPAVPGKSHFITSIQLVRVATGAVAGTAVLIHTSTNLPGNPAWSVGNAIAAGQDLLDLDYRPTTPLRSLAPGVATTIVMPAAGLLAINRANVTYYVA